MRALILVTLLHAASCLVVPLDNSNIDGILSNNEVVFVNFYADWCRFSQQLKPIFLEASELFANQEAGKVVWASVDADRQPAITTKYHVNKYPTLKLFRNGEIIKKEYRSRRSVDALSDFVTKQLASSLKTVENPEDLKQKLEASKRTVVGLFPALEGAAYDNFKKIASILREDCNFFAGQNPGFAAQLNQGAKVAFRPSNYYSGDLGNLDQLKSWVSEHCIPLVREITFENAEELTEEGLPFLILFKHPDDNQSEKVFSDAVIREIPDQKATVNCLIADGKKFAHPLHHLGKSENDLPVIAIDSFRHMYLFPNTNDLTVSGKLRQFVLDLHSGKLHREFHHGPDPVQPAIENQQDPSETQPPPSVFEKLKPSHNRYTLLDKDEL
ncbi:unnamed protein product [Auanema sp. JU1783]|nr:unnamed protein product [Auanema sp. JU1783]